MEFLGRFGLLIAAGCLFWLARRLHTKGRSKIQKNTAFVLSFLAGLALMGTFVGGWMSNLTAASPSLAAAFFLVAVGGTVVDLWTDKQADKFAFHAALLIPLAIAIGIGQMSNLGDELQRNGEQITAEIEQAGN